MWINYLKIIVRTLYKSKFYSLINIIGLSIGISAFILIMMFVDYEYSYDKHFKDADQIYRVTIDMEWEQAPTQYAALPPGPSAIHLLKEYPEIIAACRFNVSDRKMLEAIDENNGGITKRFYEENILNVDSNFFKVFDLEVIEGDKTRMLTYQNSIVISESLANKYFGSSMVVGKKLRMNNIVDLTVRGGDEGFAKKYSFSNANFGKYPGRFEF